MNYDYYKAASEATDADERALIPAFKRIRPQTRENTHELGLYGICKKCHEWPIATQNAQCKAWDEAAEHNRDLEHESRETEEREASGYWDNCEEGK